MSQAGALAARVGTSSIGSFVRPVGALLPELFGAARRNIGVSVTREAAAVLAGGFAPLVGIAIIGWAGGALGDRRGAWMPIAGYLELLTLVTFATTFVTPEPRGRDLYDLADAQPVRRAGGSAA